MQHKYKISTIMPVYNSALYLGEAIESIINQSIGFKNIQLIIVNDGSTDNSAEIINEYAQRYSNIIFVNKENGGVSSARNEALKYVEGKYVSFVDPDDTISSDTYKNAYEFFEENYDKTSVVVFPIYFFGEKNGPHILNDKFEGGNRIIDLAIEGYFQLHITSSLIKADVATKMHFKSELVTSEDAEVILKALINNPHLGVVANARYNYRKHGVSLINSATHKREWYLPHLQHYFNSIMDYAIEIHGEIPFFVQNAMMYDLSWKLSQRKVPSCLGFEEASQFVKELYACIMRLSDSAIMEARLPLATKYHLIAKKLDDAYAVSEDDICIGELPCLSMCQYSLEFVEDCVDKIEITTRATVPASMPQLDSGSLYVNGHAIEASGLEYEEKAYFFENCITKNVIFRFIVEKSLLGERNMIYFGAKVGKANVIFNNITFGKFCPLERKYQGSFIALNGFALSYHENALIIERSNHKDIKKRRKALLREIWKSNGFAERKAVIARLLARVYKKLHKKPIWLISDRIGKASDNGEALFNHLNKIKFKNAEYHFAIRKGADFARLKKEGRVVDRASLKYKILFLASDIIISSHGEEFVINPFDYYSRPYKDILCEKKFVFLQHGVTKDDLSAWLNKYSKNIKGFVVSSPLEEKSILDGAYHYTKDEVWLTGMPRFDRLDARDEKIVAVLPTWRKYLAGEIDISNGEWSNTTLIKDSKYVSFYNALVNDKRLSKTLEENGYRLLFAPHPNMRRVLDFIDTPSSVLVPKNVNYSEIFAKSSLIVTDYSSVAFDGAYLRKSIIYTQFDRDEFFSGEHAYERGYFDYEKNGFGKVTYTLDEALDAMIQCIENACALEDNYRERIDEFFVYNDKNSSQRVLEKIIELGAKNDKCK